MSEVKIKVTSLQCVCVFIYFLLFMALLLIWNCYKNVMLR
jgi:hypothetical protein